MHNGLVYTFVRLTFVCLSCPLVCYGSTAMHIGLTCRWWGGAFVCLSFPLVCDGGTAMHDEQARILVRRPFRLFELPLCL